MRRSRYCLLAVFIGGTALALQNPRPVDDREWSPVDVKATETATQAHDPQLKDPWDDLVAGTGDGCKAVGGNAELFDRINHYRGNSYRVTREVSLTEIKMLLGINVSTPLYISIHRRETGTTGQWIRYPEGIGWTIPTPTATGVANPIFYSSGEIDPPVLLEPGFDYAIGFAWTSSVRYFKDLFQTYPNSTPPDFDFGQVMGLVGLNPVTPPLANELTMSVSPNGAYAMALCLSGACCPDIGTQCTDVSEGACLKDSGWFTAAGITCEDLAADGESCPLINRACCFSETNCNDLNFYACDARDGNWVQAGLCGNTELEPCAPRGGCCLNDGSCINELSQNQCDRGGGIYRGDGIGCASFPPCTAGACCVGESCNIHLTESGCHTAGGEFAGPGTNCNSNPCVRVGACCRANGTCADNVAEASCRGAGESFRGTGTSCASLQVPCGRGACCIEEIGCRDSNGNGITRSFCESTLGGTFRGHGSTCNTISPRCPGTCCWDDCTEDVTPEACYGKVGGTFVTYTLACEDNPCQVTGTACCLPSGDCANVSSGLVCSVDLRGVLQLGQTCDTATCPVVESKGACCRRNVGLCEEAITETQCSAGFNTEWIQDGACADMNPICEPVGACCDAANLTCVNGVLEDNCDHSWTAAKLCSSLDPPCEPSIACCTGIECRTITASECFALGGTPLGEGAICEPEICAPRGACCDEESCLPDLTEAACDAVPGVYQGDDSTCEAGVTCIPTGACCTDQQCSLTTEENCAGTFRGDNSQCTPNLCVPTGACCTGLVDDCSITTEATCENGDGIYAGDGTTCNTGPCDRGACCDAQCGCSDQPLAFECRSAGGVFHVDTACDNVECVNEIVSADPRDCGLDARQSPPGAGPAGEIDAILVKFLCALEGAVQADFEVFHVPAQDPAVAIDHIMVEDNEVHVMLDAAIPLQKWTCLRHIPSDSQTCVGYLPGDVNNDEISTAEDVVALVADLDAGLMAIPQQSLTLIQCDLDRSGECTPQDILRAIDLLGGEDQMFASWNNNPMPAPCPSDAP